MILRTRSFAGLLTLLAMLLSLGEVGMASVCASMMEMEETEAVQWGATGTEAPTACTLASGHDREGSGAGCPLAPVVTSGCAAAATLPSAPVEFHANPREALHPVLRDGHRPAPIRTDTLFRPPRA